MEASSLMKMIHGYEMRTSRTQTTRGQLIRFPENWHRYNRGVDRSEPPQYKLHGIPAGFEEAILGAR